MANPSWPMGKPSELGGKIFLQAAAEMGIFFGPHRPASLNRLGHSLGCTIHMLQ